MDDLHSRGDGPEHPHPSAGYVFDKWIKFVPETLPAFKQSSDAKPIGLIRGLL
jgi:hypothetical protein